MHMLSSAPPLPLPLGGGGRPDRIGLAFGNPENLPISENRWNALDDNSRGVTIDVLDGKRRRRREQRKKSFLLRSPLFSPASQAASEALSAAMIRTRLPPCVNSFTSVVPDHLYTSPSPLQPPPPPSLLFVGSRTKALRLSEGSAQCRVPRASLDLPAR